MGAARALDLKPVGRASGLECRIIDDAGALDRLRPQWTALMERSTENVVTLTPAWMLTWWRVFGRLDGRELKTALLYDNGRLVGIAPWLKRRHVYRGHLPFQRIEPLGTGEDPQDEVCSDYADLIAERGFEAAVANSLAAALASGAFGDWDELVLPASSGEAPLPRMLADSLAGIGFQACSETIGEVFYIPLPDSWEEYLGALRGPDRYYLRRSLRDFESWSGSDYELKTASCAPELERGKEILIELHNERWKREGHGGAFASSLFTAFHSELLPRLLDERAVELSWLTVRGEPIAALYNIVWDGKVYFYQSGRKPGVPKGIRPGVVIHQAAIKQAIEAGRREYDFLGGPSQFKRQMALASRPLDRIRVVKPSLVEFARSVTEQGIARTRGLRRLVNRISSGLHDTETHAR
ncbi:MAG TPA: GNAT family N-acetyltransferase [Blastocatellia bacterium]|nr:GNAT family N-acetyltransferase [Blastocatellia bacterium]